MGGRALDLFAGPGGRLPQRFIDRITFTDAGCWQIAGYEHGNGYARTKYEGRRWYLHRLAYTLIIGPIPDDATLDHRCRNRKCINPAHLEPVSNEENILRGESPPARNARKDRCPQGHAYTVQSDGTRRCEACRRQRREMAGEISGRGLPATRTQCPHGHPYDEENTYLVKRPDGSVKQRMCRECMRIRNRERRARAKGGDAQ